MWLRRSLLLAGVALLAVACGSDDDGGGASSGPSVGSTATVPVPPSDSPVAFDFLADSLCEWFTAEDVNRIVATAQQRAETAFEFVPMREGDCSPDGLPGGLWGSEGWMDNPAAESSMSIGLARGSQGTADSFVSHELLDESVTYHVIRYNVAYDAGLQVDLRVAGHDRVLRFVFGVGDDEAVSTPKYETVGLAIADELLREMNWTGSGEAGTADS